MLPMQVSGALKNTRINPLMNCVICVESLVMRVMSDPAFNFVRALLRKMHNLLE